MTPKYKNLCLLLLCICAFTCAASALEQTDHYDDGKLKSRYTITAKGEKSGAYWLYYPNGKIQETGSYTNGLLSGTIEQFYDTGKPKQKSEYHLGKLNGRITDFDALGHTLKTAEYRDDQLNGVYREFTKDVPVVERIYVGGVLAYPRSPAIITQTLQLIQHKKIPTTQATSPIPKHPGGNESQSDREEAVRVLMGYRYLCYLPWETLSLDATYNAHTEAAAAILGKIGHLDHEPANPGWNEDDYHYAYKGTSSSNLAEGLNCANSIDAYMHENGILGHRRWCLNPPMGRTGISLLNNFSAMWAMDSSLRKAPDYEFVAYPAPGYFPSSHFNAGDTWSISLNPGKYRQPDGKEITVTVSPAKVVLDQAQIETAPALRQTRCDVNNDGYGINNCIMFTSAGISTQTGSAYQVEIKGLKTRDDQPATIKYLVEFFRQ